MLGHLEFSYWESLDAIIKKCYSSLMNRLSTLNSCIWSWWVVFGPRRAALTSRSRSSSGFTVLGNFRLLWGNLLTVYDFKAKNPCLRQLIYCFNFWYRLRELCALLILSKLESVGPCWFLPVPALDSSQSESSRSMDSCELLGSWALATIPEAEIACAKTGRENCWIQYQVIIDLHF